MWACLAPLILKLREKVPLRSGWWVGGTLYHLAFSFTVMTTFYLGRIYAPCPLLQTRKLGLLDDGP